MMEKFLNWFRKKTHISQQTLPADFHVSVGEIWWCSLGENVGIEINGKGDNYLRPVLILKVFNRQHVWVVPLSSQEQSQFHIKISSLSTSVTIVVSQLRAVSTLRLFRYVNTISVDDFHFITDSIIELLKYRTPTFSDEGSSRPGGNNGPIDQTNKLSIIEDKNNATLA